MKPKRSKYGNMRVEFGGMTFDSILERDRWIFLQSEQAQARIFELRRQVTKQLIAYGKPICQYVADFEYHLPGGARVIEDVKGGIDGEATMTDAFRIKRKLYEAMTDQPIHIVTKQNLTSLP